MGEINAYDKIMFEDQKKEKIWKLKDIFIKSHLKDCFKMEFTAC